MNPQASSSAVAPDTAPLRPRPASRFLAAFHAYAGWLVGISWWRFLLLSLLLLIVAGILGGMVPSWSYETNELLPPPPRKAVIIERSPAESGASPASGVRLRQGKDRLEITIDEQGVRILRRPAASASASAAGSLPALPSAPAAPVASGAVDGQARPLVEIHVSRRGWRRGA